MRFTRLFRYDPVKDPTARLRLDYDPDFGNAILSDEDVLPEQSDNPDARCLGELTSMQLTTSEVRWLATAASELAALMERGDAEAQAELDARKTVTCVDVGEEREGRR